MKKNHRDKKSDKYNNKQGKLKCLGEWNNIAGVVIAFISMMVGVISIIIALKTLYITREIGYTANKISEQSNSTSIYMRESSKSEIEIINVGGRMNTPNLKEIETILMIRILEKNKNEEVITKFINLDGAYKPATNKEDIASSVIYKLNNKYLDFTKLQTKLEKGKYKNCNINLNVGVRASIIYSDFQKKILQHNEVFYLNEWIPSGAFKQYSSTIKIINNEEENLSNLVKIIEDDSCF